jgi:hypothetical protein
MDTLVWQRLGSVAPGRQPKGRIASDRAVVDPRPLVLWRGDKPAATLYFREQRGPLGFEQTIAKIVGEGFGGGVMGGLLGDYPIRFRETWPGEADAPRTLNCFLPPLLTIADVNGDGVDELVLPRGKGGIEVYSAEKHLHSFSGEGHLPRGYFYSPADSYTIRLPGRDVVFVISKLRKAEDGDNEADPVPDVARYALHRVDRHGIARVALRGATPPPEAIVALGALNRPGSSEIDELLVIGPSGRLFRYRPDGTALADPRQVPVTKSDGIMFLPAPESPYAILRDNGRLHFITPDKPINWVQTIDLEQLGNPDDAVDVVQVVDFKSGPKVVASVEKRAPRTPDERAVRLFAVNAEGKCFAPGGERQAWRPLPQCQPYHKVTLPSPVHKLVGIVPSSDGSDDLLIVHSRKAQNRTLTHEEILAAAEKFLMPADLQFFRQQLVVHLSDMEFTSDEKGRSKSATEQIKTIDDWKRLLPDSYEEVRRWNESHGFDWLQSHLVMPLTFGVPLSSHSYRNLDEYRAWLAEQTVGPQTRFALLRGDVETPWEVEASVARDPIGVIFGGPVTFHAGKTAVTIVFSADASKVPEPEPGLLPEMRIPGFFVLGPSTEPR